MVPCGDGEDSWESHWTARWSNQLILKEINPEYLLEGLMLKLKLQYFSHLMQRTDSLEKTLMLGKTEGGRRRGWQRRRWLDSITDPMDMSVSKLRELVMNREACRAAVHVVAKRSQTRLNWTEGLGTNRHWSPAGLALVLVLLLLTFVDRRKMHNLKVENLCFIWRTFWGPWPGRQPLRWLWDCSENIREEPGYMSFLKAKAQNLGSRNSKRLWLIKEKSDISNKWI